MLNDILLSLNKDEIHFHFNAKDLNFILNDLENFVNFYKNELSNIETNNVYIENQSPEKKNSIMQPSAMQPLSNYESYKALERIKQMINKMISMK